MVAGSVTGTRQDELALGWKYNDCILSHLKEQGCSLISTWQATVSLPTCINTDVDVRGQTGHGGSTHRLHHEYTTDADNQTRIVCKKTSSVFMMGAKQDRLVF